MFDPTVEVATAAQLADRIAAVHATVREAECEELVLAAAWANVHYLDTGADDYRPLVQRACAWGGDGCPQVAEHCAHELGALRGTGAVAARMLIADALDLRHRLPRLWMLVRTGAVRAWQARAVAQATHELSWEACAVGPVLSLSKGRPDVERVPADAGVAPVPSAARRGGARGRPRGSPGA